MTKLGKSKYPAAARVGINPTPTLAECCKRFNNPLIAKVLHASTVGAGFIPALPATDKIKSKCPAAARVGINPTPTLAECCKRFSISGIENRIIRVVCAEWADCSCANDTNYMKINNKATNAIGETYSVCGFVVSAGLQLRLETARCRLSVGRWVKTRTAHDRLSVGR